MAARSLDGAAERRALDRWNNEGGAPAADARHGRRLTANAVMAAAGPLLVAPASHPHAFGDPVAGIGRTSVIGRGPMDDRGAPPST